MMEILLAFIFIFPTILGVCEILHFIKIHITASQKPNRLYTVIVLDNDSPQEQLNYIINQLVWYGNKKIGTVIAVNSFLDEVNFSSCKDIAEKYNLVFCSAKELGYLLSFK